MFTSSHTLPPQPARHRSSVAPALVIGSAALAGYLAAVVTTPLPPASASAKAVPRLAAPKPPRLAAPETEQGLQSLAPSETNMLSGESSTETTPLPEPDPSQSSVPPPMASQADTSCPFGMKLVEGQYCPAVVQRCLDYLSVERDRCAEYAEGSQCVGTPAPLRFCIDEFEYPNVQGVKPAVAVSYLEAEAKCEEQGKRLCTAREWTLACEGPERLPYPTGHRRDEQACNYDKPYRLPNNDAYANRRTREAEIKRLDQRVASGEMAECVSPFGVHDMTGNVDEWVLNEAGSSTTRPYISGLKGGYWGPVRNRCRPMTVDHNEWHSGYQIGFRCCAGGQDHSSGVVPRPEGEGPRAEANLEDSVISG